MMGGGDEFGKQPIRTLNFYFRATGTVGFEYQNNLFKFLPYFIFRLSLALSSVFLLLRFFLLVFLCRLLVLCFITVCYVFCHFNPYSALPFLTFISPPSLLDFFCLIYFEKGIGKMATVFPSLQPPPFF